MFVEFAGRADHGHFALLDQQPVIGQLTLGHGVGNALRAVIEIDPAMAGLGLHVALGPDQHRAQANRDAGLAHFGQAGGGVAAAPFRIHAGFALVDLVDRLGLIAIERQRVPR